MLMHRPDRKAVSRPTGSACSGRARPVSAPVSSTTALICASCASRVSRVTGRWWKGTPPRSSPSNVARGGWTRSPPHPSATRHPPAIEQVRQAMVELGDQQQHLAPRLRRPDRPGHAARPANAPNRSAERRRAHRQAEEHAHEEAAGFRILELRRLADVRARLEQQAGDAGDDAGLVGTGQGENVQGDLQGIAHALLFDRGRSGRTGPPQPKCTLRQRARSALSLPRPDV